MFYCAIELKIFAPVGILNLKSNTEQGCQSYKFEMHYGMELKFFFKFLV